MSTPSFDIVDPAHPERVVAVGQGGPRCVGDLLVDAARIRDGLPGGAPGDELLLGCTDRYLFAAAALAAWDRGHAVALPPNLRPGTVRGLLEGGTVRGELTEDGEGISVKSLLAGEAPGHAVDTRIQGGRHIATVHTSGSTGGHRGSPKTATQLLGEAQTLVRAFDLREAGPVLTTVPPHHIYGLLFGVLAPLAARIPFVREGALHAETVAAVVAREDVKVLVSTPAHLRGLAVLDPGALDGLSMVFSSGAPLHPETGQMLWDRFGLAVTEVLGSTETGGIGWRRSDGGEIAEQWQALPGVSVHADGEGRLMLDSPFCPADDPRPRPCDDRIEMVGPDRFRHLGRLDDVVKIAGKRLSLGELERRLMAIHGVLDAAVLSEKAPDGRGWRVRAIAVAPGRTPEDIREALLQYFDATVLPRRVVLVEALPRESTGKLSRERLLEVLDGAAPRVPEIIETRDEADGARVVEIRIPSSFYYFQGHFPLEPILPGVAQLEVIVLGQVRARWPELTRLRKISRLKFMKKLGPGDEVQLTLRRDAQRVVFEVRQGETITARGTMTFAA